MAKYDGVVTLADGDIPVNVAFDNGHIRMSSAGTEIGQWSADDCLIEATDDETFTISAEDETLRFIPDEPVRFAAAIGAKSTPNAPPESVGIREAPPPRTVTMIGFYALCVVTAALAVWSFLALIL